MRGRATSTSTHPHSKHLSSSILADIPRWASNCINLHPVSKQLTSSWIRWKTPLRKPSWRWLRQRTIWHNITPAAAPPHRPSLLATWSTLTLKTSRRPADVPTVLLDGKNTQSDRCEVNRTILSGWGARMGSPRPSYKELRSRKVAIGSNSLEVESRKVEGRKVAKSQSRRSIANVAISKFTKVEILETMGENCISYFDCIYHLIYMETRQ